MKINHRVGLFIDSQNLYHSAKAMFQSKVNYSKLVESAVARRNLIRAFAYVIKSDAGDENSFFDALEKLGIEIRVKDLKVFHSGEKKADWDVGIAMDIVRMTDKLDVVVLASGDGDFTEVIKYAKSRGVRTEVLAFANSAAKELVDECDEFYDLGQDPRRFLLKSNSR